MDKQVLYELFNCARWVCLLGVTELPTEAILLFTACEMQSWASGWWASLPEIPSTRFEPSLGWFQTCCCLQLVHESWASANDSIFISLRAGKDWTASDALLGFESNPHSSTLDIADSSFSNLVFECKKISLHRTIVVKYKYFENEENETFLDWQLWSEYFSNPDFAWQEGQLLIGLSRKPWLSWSCGSS